MGSEPADPAHRRRLVSIGLLAAALVLLFAASAFAGLQSLPSDGSQVNNDPGAGIDPTNQISGDAPNADVVAGALTAGGKAVPWAIFRQETATADQIFSRSFANGVWTTRGNGTVGGRSSGSSTLTGSLNFSQISDGEAPSIDFAGAGRAVPWATWYENTSGAGFGNNNIFASRFDNSQNKWVFSGQGRNNGGSGPEVPSLNIHTDQDAENPEVAGGSAVDPTKPGPWVTWQETTTAPVNGKDQIFVSRSIGPGQTNCMNVTPTAHDPTAAPPGGFCWQQTGIPRVGGGTDPSLNVDPTRNGIEPDIAFTGTNDSVPWVVWYEKDAGTLGLRTNEMVFAAKGVSDGVTANGGFHWVVVGQPGGGGTLDTSDPPHSFGPCAVSTAAEDLCSLNKVATNDAEDPAVAAGTMTAGGTTVPWVVWDEKVSGVTQVFVARLVGGDHFELANNGQPISLDANPSTRADITFSGNTPYVSWRENTGGAVDKGFVGHLVNAANPTFVLDQSNISLTTATVTPTFDVRLPISSSCFANPFNQDGAACQGGAIGTPFFLVTNGSPTAKLFGDAYQTDAPVTGTSSGVSSSGATVSGSVNPEGAPVQVEFQFGTTTNYGQTTTPQSIGPSNSSVPFAATISGQPPSTLIHYRALAITDFGTVPGGDQTFTTAASPPPNPPANDEPHSKIKSPRHSIRSKKFKSIKGTASDNDGVKRVEVAVVGFKGGARVAARRRGTCLLLRSNGKLKRTKADKRGRCTKKIFLRAKGTTSWIFKLKKKLPKGSYVIFSRAIDKTGKVETHFSSRRGNRVAIKVK